MKWLKAILEWLFLLPYHRIIRMFLWKDDDVDNEEQFQKWLHHTDRIVSISCNMIELKYRVTGKWAKLMEEAEEAQDDSRHPEQQTEARQ